MRKIQFLKLSKIGNYLVTLGLVERAQVQYSKTKATLQDQDCSIVGSESDQKLQNFEVG